MCADRVALHVLVVDDYPDVAEMLALLLVDASPMRITTDIGFDGEQALRLALAHRPSVAVLDIDMPAMNGIEAALRIRRALDGDAPLLIAVTGNTHPAEATRVFDRVLRKPVDIDALLRLMARD